MRVRVKIRIAKSEMSDEKMNLAGRYKTLKIIFSIYFYFFLFLFIFNPIRKFLYAFKELNSCFQIGKREKIIIFFLIRIKYKKIKLVGK